VIARGEATHHSSELNDVITSTVAHGESSPRTAGFLAFTPAVVVVLTISIDEIADFLQATTDIFDILLKSEFHRGR
jgi:hypothetical protein